MTENYNKELDFKILSENNLNRNFSRSILHPFMKPYTLKTKTGYSLNFRCTVNMLNSLISYINKSVNENSDFKILFLDIKNNIALDNLPSNIFYSNKWLNGFLTNFNCTKIEKQEINDPKEKKLMERKISRYKGIAELTIEPNLVICSNMNYCLNAIKECKKSKIKVACISGPRSNPKLVDFPIVGNDNNEDSIKFIFEYIIKQIIINKEEN